MTDKTDKPPDNLVPFPVRKLSEDVSKPTFSADDLEFAKGFKVGSTYRRFMRVALPKRIVVRTDDLEMVRQLAKEKKRTFRILEVEDEWMTVEFHPLDEPEETSKKE